MIDFIKIQVFDSGLIDYFRNHPRTDWLSDEDKFNRHDCELVTTKVIRVYKSVKFCFYNSRLDILFRPHYYFNDDLHNANDFSVSDCIDVIRDFESIFEVDLKLLPVVNLEYGINVISPIDIRDLITYLYSHDRNEFRTDPNLAFSKRSFKPDGRGKANVYKIVKAYAKGIQQGAYCHPDTFRFEIKSQMRKFIRQFGIKTIADLLNRDVYALLGESIIVEFEEVLLLDIEADMTKLSPSDQSKLKAYQNSMRWYRLLQQHRNAFSKGKQNYYALLDKTGFHLKARLMSIIQSKVYDLTANKSVKVQIPLY